MVIKTIVPLILLSITPAIANAQVANPTAVLFNSADHAVASVVNYRGFVFPAAADPVTATPLITGVNVPKANVTTIVATPTDYRLTFVQMGITLPACVSVPCPQYRMLIEANGPNGSSVRSGMDASLPFTATLPTPPDAPTNLRPN